MLGHRRPSAQKVLSGGDQDQGEWVKQQVQERCGGGEDPDAEIQALSAMESELLAKLRAVKMKKEEALQKKKRSLDDSESELGRGGSSKQTAHAEGSSSVVLQEERKSGSTGAQLLKEGDAVEARHNGQARWFPGKIDRVGEGKDED